MCKYGIGTMHTICVRAAVVTASLLVQFVSSANAIFAFELRIESNKSQNE